MPPCACPPAPVPVCRHALVAAGRVHSVLATDEISERSSAFEAQGVTSGVLTMCHRCGTAGGLACPPACLSGACSCGGCSSGAVSSSPAVLLLSASLINCKLPLPTLLPARPYSWGSAKNGRLGTGMFEDASFPEMLPDLDGEQLVDLACGLDHTLVLVRGG